MKKERPILFSSPMVRALLSGAKTVRRMMRGKQGNPSTTPALVPWRSPLLLRRVDSRITLEVTSVHVQRLQDITHEDAKAEGVVCLGGESDKLAFTFLWDSINGKRADWKSNPWVWAVSFKMI